MKDLFPTKLIFFEQFTTYLVLPDHRTRNNKTKSFCKTVTSKKKKKTFVTEEP